MDAMTSLKEELTKRDITLPLAHIRDWKPFTIDALGLVTLLGADEVNQSVGTLQHRHYTEYLPLLAAFVIAGDRFNAEQPGFVLYNLDAGITSTELKGWFTRWLMSQKVNNATTVLEWQKLDGTRSWDKLVAPALSCVVVMPLLVITVLVGDWYGVGNAVAIIISILTRVYLLSRRRHVRDKAAKPEENKTDEQIVKKRLFVIRSDGRLVTCLVPQSVLFTFVNQDPIPRHRLYHCARWLCWVALGVQMCILGMCSLFTQIYTVLLLVLSTWWFTSDFFWDIGRQQKHNTTDGSRVTTIPFNRDWCVRQTDHPKVTTIHEKPVASDKRQWAWARLNLTAAEEEAMRSWNLFPIEAKNEEWFPQYKDLKESLNDNPSGDAEKASRTSASAAQDIDASPPRSARSTDLLMGGALQPTPSGPSLDPNSASDSSANPSLSSPPRIPAGD
jgi:hypothetical protein